MNKVLRIGLIMIAVLAVGIADILIKKIAATTQNYSTAIRNPWMFAVIGLYIIQILVFTYVFVKKAELGIVGIVQTALYAIIVIAGGILFFKEKINPTQGIGMGLALIGTILMNP